MFYVYFYLYFLNDDFVILKVYALCLMALASIKPATQVYETDNHMYFTIFCFIYKQSTANTSIMLKVQGSGLNIICVT